MKRSLITLVAMGLGISLIGAACGSDDDGNDSAGGETTDKKVAVTIGAQDFGESKILAEIYKQGLEAEGYAASVKFLGTNSFRDIEVDAFEQGEINFAPEYAASMLEFLNNKKGEASGDVSATVAKLETYLEAKSLHALEPSDAVDTNAFVMTKAKSDELGIKSLSDLASKGKDLKLGAPGDCVTNPFCIPGLKNTYGLDLTKNVTSLGAGQVADALDAGSVQVGLLFSTDGTIKTKNYVLLDDDKNMLAADNVIPVVSQDLIVQQSFIKAANAISAKLTTDALIEMNKRFDVDKEDAELIAKEFLEENDLL
ncbi:MAG: ABC transporter substrate-binding protein [Acidimicrobiales bacterium]|nr:ABC transporter substrate-binding protein [Acidimicrobiales bacterium]